MTFNPQELTDIVNASKERIRTLMRHVETPLSGLDRDRSREGVHDERPYIKIAYHATAPNSYRAHLRDELTETGFWLAPLKFEKGKPVRTEQPIDVYRQRIDTPSGNHILQLTVRYTEP